MEWSDKQSIILTKLWIWLFIAGYLAVLVTCPFLVAGFIKTSHTASQVEPWYFIITIYAAAVPIGALLYQLWRLVRRIGDNEIFTRENIRGLRIISWMCFAVAAICLASACYFVFWGLAACCMAFMGLLIRVIKNVFVRAKQIKDEYDYTI